MLFKKPKISTVLIIVFIAVAIALTVLMVLRIRSTRKLSKKRLINLITEDLKFWKGLNEKSIAGSKKISEYWTLVNMNLSPEQLQTDAIQQKYPWSAIYISNLMDRWGAGNRFKYSGSHSSYILESKQARTNQDDGKIFWGFRPSEAKVEIGDLIGISRASGINYDNVYSGAPTHTDLVFKIEKVSDGYEAYAVGGNVSNTLGVTKFKLDENRKLVNPSKYLILMKNTKL